MNISLGKNGPVLSRLISGQWRLADWGYSVSERLRFIHDCLDVGITTFDHADIYGNYECEALFGEALARESGLRDRIQIITKCGIKVVSAQYPARRIGHYDTSREHIMLSAETSLKRLSTDRIDVLLLHRPDPLMDVAEVTEAFISLRDAGKVLFFGVSNFTPGQVELLQSALPFPLVTNQVECSVLEFEVMHDGTLDHCRKLAMRPMAWSPMGKGRLFLGDDEQTIRVRRALEEVGEDSGSASIDQVALAWILKHPSEILPVLGTGKMNRIRSAVSALELNITREQWFAVWQASKGHCVP